MKNLEISGLRDLNVDEQLVLNGGGGWEYIIYGLAETGRFMRLYAANTPDLPSATVYK